MTADGEANEGFKPSDPIHEWIEHAAGTDAIACPICRNLTWIVHPSDPIAFVGVGTAGQLKQSTLGYPLEDADDVPEEGSGSMHLVYAVCERCGFVRYHDVDVVGAAFSPTEPTG